ncbi:hypothetical protein F990_02958 [Acinetobacter tjernbergiae DSM 14971 = CIP 107465]|uniref:Uncharacterized protein n=2 Tax=Acinetobacter tjernbergiae TaxID=202955 RepID=V2UZP1_9GAMM|nr:hypothetical protein F990_02958 [Acinetobacter tjernbergiae DSM 14971 = CIP 107465]
MMKKVPSLCLATALIASSSLWAAETNTTTANANTATAEKTLPYGDNPSIGRVLLYKTGKGIQNLGHSIQHGSEKTSAKISKSWQEAKVYSAEQSQSIQAKAEETKEVTTKKLQETKDAVIGTNDGNIPIVHAELSQSSSN